jgi:hypothetical protein
MDEIIEYSEIVEWFNSLTLEEKEELKKKMVAELLPKFKKNKDILTINENNQIV